MSALLEIAEEGIWETHREAGDGLARRLADKDVADFLGIELVNLTAKDERRFDKELGHLREREKIVSAH